MIGVIAKENEKDLVREFFELFKTPWGFFRESGKCCVVVSSGEYKEKAQTGKWILYGTEISEFDRRWDIEGGEISEGIFVAWGDEKFLIRGSTLKLPMEGKPFIKGTQDDEVVAAEVEVNGSRIIRVGFNLFEEVKTLMSAGQPAKYAHIPTLEIHIDMLRRLMIRAGAPFVEVPAVPGGFDFSACLTHDIDFSGIKAHIFDHTMFGFLYRALVRSTLDALRGKTGWGKVRKNLIAALSLPAVYLGLTKNFLDQQERYLEIEKGLKSTFFFAVQGSGRKSSACKESMQVRHSESA